MYANLMSSTRPRNGAKEAETIAGRGGLTEPTFDKKFSLRGRTCRMNHLFKPDRRVSMFALAIQRSVDNLVLPFRPAPNDCKIFLAQLMSLHQEPKIARSCCGFCNQHESAGFAVKSVHDRNLSAAGDLECEELTQLFPQSWCAVRFCGVNEKKRWLIDDDMVIGFINDFKIEWCNNGVME
jgi:hypothetical protein